MMSANKSAEPELKKFAITLFCALGILGGFVLWRKGEAGFLLWVIGIVILSMGLLRPRLIGPIYRGWMEISFVMGFFMTHLVLALMYYFIFTPVTLVMKLLGKDSLRLKHNRNAKSYWIKRGRREFSREGYEKMF